MFVDYTHELADGHVRIHTFEAFDGFTVQSSLVLDGGSFSLYPQKYQHLAQANMVALVWIAQLEGR
jgi:hypothetical protein